ncbi:hypothetical protein EXIGUO9Y_380164 [Exiguobacterium oxidotolerans]|uniref:Uncharacterized protein n=1 Tax=Exiguobacterium oxidotolerans TaxID=223958 RepID=A0A653IGJ6_9BACL|nr:hypothetical protein EXIGUO9Y_380164 [Exiguobacterium oxidotolerans]
MIELRKIKETVYLTDQILVTATIDGLLVEIFEKRLGNVS